MFFYNNMSISFQQNQFYTSQKSQKKKSKNLIIISIQMYKNNQPQCSHANRPYAICINPICKQTPFICLQKECQLKHFRCKIFFWNNLLNIMKQKNYVNQYSQNRLNAIKNTIEQLLVNLETQIRKLYKIEELFKMNNQQKEFMNLIQSGNYQVITSKYVSQFLQYQQNEILFDEYQLEKLEKQSCLLFENYLKISEITDGVLKTNSIAQNFFTNPQSIHKSQQSKVDKKISEEQEFSDQSQFKYQKVDSSLKLQKYQKNQIFCWAVQKSQINDFKIFKNYATKITSCKFNDNYNNTFLLINPELPRNKQTSWIVQLIKGYMEVGICIKSIIVKNKYGFTDTEAFKRLNHGVYTIDPEKRTYSHHKQEQNNKKIGLKFKLNDEILMNYNPLTNKLKFTLVRTKQMTELDIIIPKKQQLHPCVWLGQPSYKVKLINIS